MRYLLLILMTLGVGCTPKVAASLWGAPLVVTGPEHNPDVMWVVMETTVPVSSANSRTRAQPPQEFFGLFAFYRRPATDPGPPNCFLAKMSGELEDLAWPGAV